MDVKNQSGCEKIPNANREDGVNHVWEDTSRLEKCGPKRRGINVDAQSVRVMRGKKTGSNIYGSMLAGKDGQNGS